MDVGIHITETHRPMPLDVEDHDLAVAPTHHAERCIVLKVHVDGDTITVFDAERLFHAIDAARENFARRHEPPENGGPVPDDTTAEGETVLTDLLRPTTPTTTTRVVSDLYLWRWRHGDNWHDDYEWTSAKAIDDPEEETRARRWLVARDWPGAELRLIRRTVIEEVLP